MENTLNEELKIAIRSIFATQKKNQLSIKLLSIVERNGKLKKLGVIETINLINHSETMRFLCFIFLSKDRLKTISDNLQSLDKLNIWLVAFGEWEQRSNAETTSSK